MKILFCEDDYDSAELVLAVLRSGGHSVEYAQTADQAVTLFDANSKSGDAPFDLLITDVEMDGHSGLFFASHARAEGFAGRIAVYTGYERDVVISSLQAVNAEYWPKPQSPQCLVHLVDGSNAPCGEGQKCGICGPLASQGVLNVCD